MKTISRLLAFHLLLSVSLWDLDGVLAAWCFIGVAIASIVHSRAEGERRMSPLVIICSAYVLNFALPTLIRDLYPTVWLSTPEAAINRTTLWAFRALCSFLFVYSTVYVMSKRKEEYRPPRRSWSYFAFVTEATSWLSVIAWFISVSIFGLDLVFISEGVALSGKASSIWEMLHIVIELRYPAIVLMIIMYNEGKFTKRLRWLLMLLCVGQTFEIIIIGSKLPMLNVLASVMLVFSFIPPRFSVRRLFSGIAIVFLIFATFEVVAEYRAIMKDAKQSNQDVSTIEVRVDSFWIAFTRTLGVGDNDTRKGVVSIEDVFDRIGSGMFSLANLFYETNWKSPHENALSAFLVPVYSVAPRILIPEKPIFFHSGRFAREYFGWTYGGISVTLPGSLYFAWGYPGLVLGMGVLGGALGYVTHRAQAKNEMSVYWIIVFVSSVLLVMNVDVTFQVVETNLIRLLMLLWVIRVAYRLKRGDISKQQRQRLSFLAEG